MERRKSFLKMWITALCVSVIILCFAMKQSVGEDKKAWQAGTIVDVKPHEAAPGDQKGPDQYDVSVQVGKKIYVVLFSPTNGWDQAQYYVGMNRTVLVDGDTLKFNDLLGRTHTMPIVSRKDAPDEKSK